MPPKTQRRVRFCRTCNARERVIVHGCCIVCGNDPDPSSHLTMAD